MIHQTGYWAAKDAPAHHLHSPKLSAWICNFLKDYRLDLIIDFGCGMGDYLRDLNNKGFTHLLGIEMDPPFTNYPFEIESHNLAYPLDLGKAGDVICLEVGEHLPPEYQSTFIDNITSHCSRFLIMSWAVKGQGGNGHFNELDNDVIIPEIEKRGFKYLPEISLDARKDIEDQCAYFRNTLMVFIKN